MIFVKGYRRVFHGWFPGCGATENIKPLQICQSPNAWGNEINGNPRSFSEFLWYATMQIFLAEFSQFFSTWKSLKRNLRPFGNDSPTPLIILPVTSWREVKKKNNPDIFIKSLIKWWWFLSAIFWLPYLALLHHFFGGLETWLQLKQLRNESFSVIFGMTPVRFWRLNT